VRAGQTVRSRARLGPTDQPRRRVITATKNDWSASAKVNGGRMVASRLASKDITLD